MASFLTEHKRTHYCNALRSEHVSHEDLLQALRENGCATLKECKLAVLEVDGSISVVAGNGQPGAAPPR